jgi:hypothetical protein
MATNIPITTGMATAMDLTMTITHLHRNNKLPKRPVRFLTGRFLYIYEMNKILYLSLIISFLSCAPSRFVRPLNKSESAVSFNFGGALIDYNGATIPVPLTSFTYGYGLNDKLTVFTGLHTTSLLFNNFQMEVGALKQIKMQNAWVPAISSALVFNYVTELQEGNPKLWPQLDANAFWNVKNKKHQIHLGYSLWVDFKMIEDNRFAIINPHIGYTYKMKSWDIGTEIKLLAPGSNNSKLFVPYQSLLGDRGATGIYVNLSKRF